jgi:hypothetical protein
MGLLKVPKAYPPYVSSRKIENFMAHFSLTSLSLMVVPEATENGSTYTLDSDPQTLLFEDPTTTTTTTTEPSSTTTKTPVTTPQQSTTPLAHNVEFKSASSGSRRLR